MDNAINTSFKDRTLFFPINFLIGSNTLGLNNFMSSGIFDISLIAFSIKELAGLSKSVCLPVIIFPLGSSSAIR